MGTPIDLNNLIAPVGGVASSIGGAIISNISQKKAQERQNDFNERMAREQNAYNSPSNQMNLLKQAGLNPNAIVGSGMLQGALQASSPEASDSKGNSEAISAAAAQIANVISDSRLKNAQAHQIESNTQLEKEKFDFDKGMRSDYFELDSLNSASRRMLNEHQANLFVSQVSHLRSSDDIMQRSFNFDVLDRPQKRRLMDAQIATLEGNESRARKVFPFTLKNFEKDFQLKDAQSIYFSKLAKKLDLDYRIMYDSNYLDNFVEGVDSIQSLSLPQKRSLIGLGLLQAQFDLEAYKGITERKNWGVIDSRIQNFRSMTNALDLRSVYQDKENRYYEWKMAVDQYLRFMSIGASAIGNVVP